MSNINSQQTLFVELEVQLDTNWPDGTQVYAKDTNTLWVLDNGVFVSISGDVTRVQNGINTFTGGTVNFPSVNVTAATLNNLTVTGQTVVGTISASTFSGGTYLSGGTNLYNIFHPIGANSVISNGTNTFTGGTFLNQTVNITAATLNRLTVTGLTALNTMSAATVSATTFYSGSTNLNQIIYAIATGSTSSGGGNVINGLNTYTGGSSSLTSVNISAATLDNLRVSGNTILAPTTATTLSVLNSGATSYMWRDASGNMINTGVTFASIIGGSGSTINQDLSNVNIIGGYKISGTNDNHTYTSNLVVTGTSNGNLYATNIFSGSTNIATMFGAGGPGGSTLVQPGTNTYTGGTSSLPTVNISALTINTLTASGASTFTSTLSANTLSAATMISGSTNLYNIFAQSGSLNRVDWLLTCSDETSQIQTGTNKVTFYAPYAFTLSDVKASLAMSGSVSATTFDVKLTGTTIFSTAKLTIDANEFISDDATVPKVITATTIANNAKITIDITTIGTGATGAKVYILGTKI